MTAHRSASVAYSPEQAVLMGKCDAGRIEAEFVVFSDTAPSLIRGDRESTQTLAPYEMVQSLVFIE